jgi:hypothetical protein
MCGITLLSLTRLTEIRRIGANPLHAFLPLVWGTQIHKNTLQMVTRAEAPLIYPTSVLPVWNFECVLGKKILRSNKYKKIYSKVIMYEYEELILPGMHHQHHRPIREHIPQQRMFVVAAMQW